MDLAAAGLIVEEHDWLVIVLAPTYTTCWWLACQYLNCRLIAMNERLRSQPQLQRIIDAIKMFLA